MYFDFLEKRIYTDANNLHSNLFSKNGTAASPTRVAENSTPPQEQDEAAYTDYLIWIKNFMSCRKKENATITTRERRKAAPRKVGRGRQHPEEGGGEEHHQKGGTREHHHQWGAATHQKRIGSRGRNAATTRRKECEPQPYFNSLYLALVWFNFDLI